MGCKKRSEEAVGQSEKKVEKTTKAQHLNKTMHYTTVTFVVF